MLTNLTSESWRPLSLYTYTYRLSPLVKWSSWFLKDQANLSKDFAEMSIVDFFHELTEMFQIGNHYIGMLDMSTQNSYEIDKLHTKITLYKEAHSKTMHMPQ